MNPALTRFRNRHLLTHAEAAKAVGMGLSTWRQLEVGYRGRAAPVTLRLLLAALDRLAEHRLDWPTQEGLHDDVEP